MKNKFIIYGVLILIFASLNFFNPRGVINIQISKLIYYIISIYFILRFNKNNIPSEISFPYRMIIIGILLSIVSASIFQSQDVSISIIATLPYLFGYLFFLILFKIKLSEKIIIRSVFFLLICSIVVYFTNLLTFPNMVFGTLDANNISDSRGALRLGIYFILSFVFTLFYAINQWLLCHKRIWLMVIVVTLIMILLSVTRQIIGVSFILSLFFILKRMNMVKRFFIVIVVSLLLVYVIPEIPIVKALMETTENQVEKNESNDDIRIRAFYFFSDTYQTNNLTRVLGNGVPSIGNSHWGNKFNMESRSLGFFSSDLGWIGFYWHFGLIAVIGVFLLLLKGTLKKKDQEHEYLTYCCITVMLLSVLSAPILIYGQVLEIMLMLYMVFRPTKSITAK